MSLPVETIQKIKKAISQIIEAVVDIMVAIANAVAKIIVTYLPQITGIVTKALYVYANSKIVHLAKHGKNRRIRKKNHKKALQQGLQNYLCEKEAADNENETNHI